MNIARILYPVQVLGPGNRVGIWLAGCSRRCKGCSNPELWEQKPEYEISVTQLFSLIAQIADKNEIDGFTISGGEPMIQATELSQLITILSGISSDILVYTGFRLCELQAMHDIAIKKILSGIAVLIDGEYIEKENNNCFLRGSKNQQIHILNDYYSTKYQKYLCEGHNQIQNFTTKDGVVSVGIHHRSF